MVAIGWLFVLGVLVVSSAMAVEGNAIAREAMSFDRHFLCNPAHLDPIRAAGNLAGRKEGEQGRCVQGWFEYDLNLPVAGWYRLDARPDAAWTEFMVDGDFMYLHSKVNGAKVGNLPLAAGKHTLRIQCYYYWTGGMPPITGFSLIPAADESLASTVQPGVPQSKCLVRKGRDLTIDVLAGMRKRPATLTGIVQGPDGKEVRRHTLVLSAGETVQHQLFGIPCPEAGEYKLLFAEGEGIFPEQQMHSIQFWVIDTTPEPRTGREPMKELLTEIDCAATEPQYAGGGATRVITKPFGKYRESGDCGWLQHLNSTDPSWFAYPVKVPEAQQPYVFEFDYPDDALRTFCMVVRDAGQTAYPSAGGADCGGEFRLTNKILTQTVIHWAHTTDLRAVLMQPQTGLRAACSKIRVYRLRGALAPLDVPAWGGRAFANWYEEGGSLWGLYGAAGSYNSYTIPDAIRSADRYARTIAYMGGDTLSFTHAIYQFGMYPSRYNWSFTGPFSTDVFGVLVLAAEKYGLRVVGEFHPEARDLLAPDPGKDKIAENRIVSRGGTLRNISNEPMFSPVHPRNQEWYIGMLREFCETYKDSPALHGVSLRLMDWTNPSLNNFHTLAWGYDDFTVGLFARETGLPVPLGEGPRRFGQRYDWLMANAREPWIAWRCRKITDLHRRIRDAVRGVRADLAVYIQGSLPSGYREAGIDVPALSGIDGIVFVGGAGYGRQGGQEVNELRRDALMLPEQLGRTVTPGRPAAFLCGSMYFEGTEVVVPPSQLGFPETTRKTWTSGVVNPSGRNSLERWAVALAEFDARYLSDGGNAYTIGQPELRPWLREYRHIPNRAFSPRADARDPVAIWEARSDSDLLFYAVNRERYAVDAVIQVQGASSVRRLATHETLPLEAGVLKIALAPYEVRVFAAPAAAILQSVTTSVPQAEVNLVASRVAFSRELARDVREKKIGQDLYPEQQATLAKAAAEAEESLKRGWYWRARTVLEQHGLKKIYRATSRIPPGLSNEGQPRLTAGAIPAAELLKHVADAKAATLQPSEEISGWWTGDQCLVSDARELAISLAVPVAARYSISVGHAAGGDYGACEVRVNGTLLGTTPAGEQEPRGFVTVLPQLASLDHGQAQIQFRLTGGKRLAVGFIKIEPIYTDLGAASYMVAGPWMFKGDLDAAMEKQYDPEKKIDLAAALDLGDGQTGKWVPARGGQDEVDFFQVTQQTRGSIHYAATFIKSPRAQTVRLAYGCDYFMRILLNGKVILPKLVQNGPPIKLNFTIDLPLQQGQNELLIKVSSGSLGNRLWTTITNPGDLTIGPRP